ERNAEYVMTIAELEEKCAAMTAKLSMINDLMEAAEQANKLAQEATETLVQESNALAAENAGLKSALNDILQPDAAVLERNHRVRVLDAMETPVTDDFLAEVRAQGVEMFADKYRAQLTALPTTPENIFDAAHVSLRYQIFDADEFAAQLRKGGAS
ncbi:Eae-like protein, partial [Salmonella enterica subsp. enterica serovar Chandans]|nr:Eae-like protein [Salmonella enterica subsp. enterica serovar Chandans]